MAMQYSQHAKTFRMPHWCAEVIRFWSFSRVFSYSARILAVNTFEHSASQHTISLQCRICC